jgi:hypothetical protein
MMYGAGAGGSVSQDKIFEKANEFVDRMKKEKVKKEQKGATR